MTEKITISEGYRQAQQELHKNPAYGVMSVYYAPLVKEIIAACNVKSLSDYGAGKKRLNETLLSFGVNIDYYPYDPAFPEYGNPSPADLVCCIDVLEHIEPDFVDNVIAELARITSNVGFYTIHTGAAVKTLPDGRNAHLIQKPSSWWLPKLKQHFEIMQLQDVENGFWIITKPKQMKNKMATIQIDNVNYNTDQLSDEAKNQLGSLQFVDAELQRLNAQAAVLQTARLAYANALKSALPPVQTELLSH